MPADFGVLAREQGTTVVKDAFRTYLNDINRVPLLTASQEVALAKRVEAHDEDARRILIDSNLRLVVNAATRYTTGRLPLLDLIQEGNLDYCRLSIVSIGVGDSSSVHTLLGGLGKRSRGRCPTIQGRFDYPFTWWRRCERYAI